MALNEKGKKIMKSMKKQYGENRGKTIRYVNVVRDFKPIGRLSNGQARLTLPAVDGAKLAIFVQAQGQGPIVGAALQD